MNPERPRVVFITGAGRSGSTLLELILDSHPRIRGLGEVNQVGPIIDKAAAGTEALCSFCGPNCSLWSNQFDQAVLRRYFSRRGIQAAQRRSLARRQRSIYAYFHAWTDEPVLTDSSKNLLWIERALRPAYVWRNMDPMLIFLTRDGRAVVNARLRKHADLSARAAATEWADRIRLTDGLFSRFPGERALRISYESLAREPEATIASVCEFLGVDFEPRILRYWENEHHVVRGNQWLIDSCRRYLRGGAEEKKAHQPKTWTGRGSENWHEKETPGIRFDERWREELSAENLAVFDSVAGDLNHSLGYNR